MEGHVIGCQWEGGPLGYEEVSLVELWSRVPSETRRALELVFDFASRPAFSFEEVLIDQEDVYRSSLGKLLGGEEC